MTEPATLSVIVPTYNRPQSLLRTIASLQQQDIALDVLVVDNAATDYLRDALAAFNRTARRPVRWIPEPRLGVHYARNTGARHATCEVLAFVDDDVTFSPGWARAYVETFALYPALVAAGGPSLPQWDEPAPAWLLRLVESRDEFPPLSLRDFGSKLSTDETRSFWSLNMAIRRTALVGVGGFPPELVGERFLGDGEGGMFGKLKASGASIGYVPEAQVVHHIPPVRSTAAYLRHRLESEGGAAMYTKLHRSGSRIHSASVLQAAAAFVRVIFLTPAALICGISRSVFSFRVRMRFWKAQGELAYAICALRDPAFREMIARNEWMSAMQP